MDRFLGSMLGLAVGDALGAPLEGLKTGHIQQLYGEATDYVDTVGAFPDRPSKWRLRGLHSGAAQQALAVAEVLCVYGEADVGALTDIFARLAQEGPRDLALGAHRGAGHHFRRSVAAMAQGDDPIRCGQPSAGNGAAKRAAPIGLYYVDDDEALARAVIAFSLPTHHDTRAIAAALAMAWTVARFARLGDEPNAPDFAIEIAEELSVWTAAWEERLGMEYASYVEPCSSRFSSGLESLASLTREANDDLAARTILESANACEPEQKIAQPNAGFAPAAVVMALYRALSARDFRSGLLAAINGGADAAAAGAMTGAILGARFGAEGVPEEWTEGLLSADFIATRARALREREVDWNCWGDLVETEIALTEQESNAINAGEREHRKEIEKRRSRLGGQRERAAARKTSEKEEFASAPETWIAGAPDQDPESRDPVQTKKDRARRGHKRIDWKEERRHKKKEKSREEEE